MSERFYVSFPLAIGTVELEGPEAHHLANVSRLRAGAQVILFNGDGSEYSATVQNIAKKRVDVLIQIADALDYVHQQKYLHRDICPRNVMVTKEGQVKLIDFGLTVPYLPAFCKPGNRTGTPNYLAPELIKRITTDHRVDLFALGVTAYETFTGMLPWEKTQSLATLQSHLNSPGKDPREFVPDLNPDLAKVLIKAVERDPARRYQTAVAFREALKALPPLE